MAPPLRAPPHPPFESFPVGPSVEEWRAMSPEERERFLIQVNDALSDIQITMSEGRPHKRAKSRAVDMLGLHFKKMGRLVYVAEDMSVVYPREPSFEPDVLAVLDVPQPEDDPRLAWVVADEGKGLDFVLEVLHRGDRKKDLVANVERYARLGIPEYFVYDRANQRILGHRLPAGGAARYERIVPQGGRYASTVLGLDLAIQDGSLRFFQGMAELFGSDDLIRRLSGMVESLEAKADEAAAQAEQAAARAGEALAALRGSVLAVMETRGIPCPPEARALVAGCEDPARLQRWLLRAMTATTAAEALAD
jgi:Uma2 family endonuclease